ncbi:serine/threonine protein kinase [Haloactinospora alba]|uniref:Serine/threonine protein kinase n=1 Tax=Haloactinospora alba TaxID=405555 RepID=A0A543NH01_9ACTN|nr:serine/threonine-protein kinase [Haloactinospora alba]TQN31030.1 serine/threonine protein kinase [Haloactinospora alba]
MVTGADHSRLAPLTADDPQRLGAFRLIGRLGAGGMGIVYAGRDAADYPAAVKMIHPHYAADAGYRERFNREVHLAQRVQGRCIAPLLAADTEAELPWLAVAYVSGPTLHSYMAANAPLRGGDLTGFAAGLAEALAAIHREGIVHRDLKPENVILASDGPKVLDFGIAQALDDVSMTHTDAVVGTPGWISPERYDGERAGFASDVFCWGGLVAYAASGRAPYGAGPVDVLRYRTVNEEPDSAAAELPTALRGVVQRALSRSPADRPTAAEALTAITGEPASDHPAGESGHEHLTRAATRLLDAGWSVTSASTALPHQPLRATTAQRPITFAGNSVHTPAELAELFRTHTQRAENWLCDNGAGKLRAWLDDIGDTAFDRDYLSGIAGREAAAVAITAFLAAQLQDSPPTYRGHDASVSGLRALAEGGPAEHQVLAEIVINEVSLITAAHRCEHAECDTRCVRLERVGHRARGVIDGALLTAGELGFRLDPTERDRAVALAVVLIDEPARGRPARSALRAWPALALPWWRALLTEALTADPGSLEGLRALVAVQLLAPAARAAAGPQWRRLLRPGTWFGPGAPRVFVLALLLWCVCGYALGTVLRLAAPGTFPAHPQAPDNSPVATGLVYQTEMWPAYLLMALGTALAPVRLRPAAVVYGTFVTVPLSLVPPYLSRPPLLVPAMVRDPLVSTLTAMGQGALVWTVLALPAGFALFLWLIISTLSARVPWSPARPLLAEHRPWVRAAAAGAGLGATIWTPVWALVLLLGGAEGELAGTGQTSVAQAEAALTLLLLASLLMGTAAYALWRFTGAHLLWISAVCGVFLMEVFAGHDLDMPVPGVGALTLWLVRQEPDAAGWGALLFLLPGAFVLGAWLSERLRYRKSAPAPAAVPHGYYAPQPYWGQATPYPGHGGQQYGHTPPPPGAAAPPAPPTRAGAPTQAPPSGQAPTRVDPGEGDTSVQG